MLTSFLTSKLAIPLFVILGLIVCVSAAYLVGKREGKVVERTQAIERSVKVLRDRGVIDERVKDSSASELCAGIGGVWSDGKCL